MSRKLVRIERTGSEVRIQARRVHWPSPNEPLRTWVTARTLPPSATDAQIEAAAALLIDDADYFAACAECGERQPVGCMHDEQICQGCAEVTLGIVH